MKKFKGFYFLVYLFSVGLVMIYSSLWWLLFDKADRFGPAELLVSGMLIFCPAMFLFLGIDEYSRQKNKKQLGQ